MKRRGFETPLNYGHRLIHDPGPVEISPVPS